MKFFKCVSCGNIRLCFKGVYQVYNQVRIRRDRILGHAHKHVGIASLDCQVPGSAVVKLLLPDMEDGQHLEPVSPLIDQSAERTVLFRVHRIQDQHPLRSKALETESLQQRFKLFSRPPGRNQDSNLVHKPS